MRAIHRVWPWWPFALALACLAGGGCGSRPAFEFDDLDLVPVHDDSIEISLGEYAIPIPAVENGRGNQPARNRFQIAFALSAVVSPQDKSNIEDAWREHEGKIRDRVIRVFRNASLDELHEPELATLKAKLVDALMPHLGDTQVRQLVIAEVVSQEI